MVKLTFDIETSALPLENFDETQQEYVFREAEKLPDGVARGPARENPFNLRPLTTQVAPCSMSRLN